MESEEHVERDRHEPLFHIPPGVLLVLGAIVTLHVVRGFLSEASDTWLVLALALMPARFAGYAAELPGGDVATWSSLLTHMFVHGDLTHLLVNVATLLAFGAAIEQRVGMGRFLVFSLVCGLAGAAAFLAVNPGLLAPMIGASGAICGLMGGVMRLFFSAVDEGGMGGLRDRVASVPLEPLRAALQDRRLLLVVAVFIVMNIAAYFGLGDPSRSGGIAWEAHIGGFIAGFALIGLFDIAPRYRADEEPNCD